MDSYSYFDAREELGLNGYIEAPFNFFRDDVYYTANWFYNSSKEDREAIDIFFAMDITPDFNTDRYVRLSEFTATWNVELERFDIMFVVNEIDLETRKQTATVNTDQECQTIIYANWSLEKQQNAALGIYSDTVNAQCANDIAKMLQDNKTNKATIDAITIQDEMDAYEPVWFLSIQGDVVELLDTPAVVKQRSMITSGEALTTEDDARISVGGDPIIADRAAHDTWMTGMYANVDSGVTDLIEPPATERQKIPVQLENADPFVFSRYQDQWGWRWRMDLIRDSVNALALYIQDSNGNYLYTTGALIRNETDDGWYTECPAGQADPTPENVYFKWIMGSAPISDNFNYKGSEDTLEGVVRSDSDYD